MQILLLHFNFNIKFIVWTWANARFCCIRDWDTWQHRNIVGFTKYKGKFEMWTEVCHGKYYVTITTWIFNKKHFSVNRKTPGSFHKIPSSRDIRMTWLLVCYSMPQLNIFFFFGKSINLCRQTDSHIRISFIIWNRTKQNKTSNKIPNDSSFHSIFELHSM